MKTAEVLKVYLAENSLKPKTESNYRWAFEKIGEVSEEFPITSGEVRVILKHFEDKLAGMSRRSLFKCLKAASRYMAREYDMPDCCLKLERGVVKVKKTQGRSFTAEEVFKCIQSCSNDNERLLIMTLVETGARISEVANFKAEDIKGDFIVSFEDGKTGSHNYSFGKYLQGVVEKMGKRGYLFADEGKESEVPSVDTLKSRIRRITKRAGLVGRKLGAHTFRHTAGTLVALETGSLIDVMNALQQEDTKTAQVYVNFAEEMKRERISPLGLVQKAIIGEDGVNSADIRQLELTKESTGMVVVEDSQGNQEMLVYEDMFSKPAEDAHIRPLLHKKDLEIIRNAFIAVGEMRRFGKELSDCRALWDRMNRKAV